MPQKTWSWILWFPRSQDEAARYMPPRATDGRADSRTFHNSQSENARHQTNFSCPYLLVYDCSAHVVLQPRTYGANGQHHLCEAVVH